jgi:hypothetical protein
MRAKRTVERGRHEQQRPLAVPPWQHGQARKVKARNVCKLLANARRGSLERGLERFGVPRQDGKERALGLLRGRVEHGRRTLALC